MRCSVWVHPPGRDPFELVLAAEPEYTEGPLGPLDAMVLCRYPSRHRDRLIDARLSIHPPKGEVWLGRIADIQSPGGHALFVCSGAAGDLGRVFPGELPYCDTSLSFDEWNGVNWGAFQRSISGGVIDMGQSPGTTSQQNDRAGYWRVYPAGTELEALKFDLLNTPHADIRLEVSAADPVTGEPVGTLATYTAAGSHEFSFSAGCSAYLIRVRINSTPSTPSRYDKFVRVGNLRLYGVRGVPSITVPAVLNHLTAKIPAWMDFDTSGAWIEPDAAVIEPLVFEAHHQIADCLNELAELRARELSVRAKLSGGRIRPAIVSRPIDPAPAYQVFPESTEGQISGGGIASLADRMRVFYTDQGGRTRYVDVIDTSDDNYLRTIGQPRMITASIPSASTSVATDYAQARLATMRRQPAAGTPRIIAPITDLRGAEVIPAQIHTMRYIRFHATEIGTADGLITHVRHLGADEADLVLATDSPALEAELAIMHKRQQ